MTLPYGRQTMEIPGWRPAPLANVRGDNWRKREKSLKAAQEKVWAAAMQSGWHFVPGRVRLTITLVFGEARRRDADNLVTRCKGAIDGLKSHRVSTVRGVKLPAPVVRKGWFEDDDTEHLELVVQAEVSKVWTGTRITLEPAA